LLYAYVKDEVGLKHGGLMNVNDKEYIVIKSIDVFEKRIERSYDYYCLGCDKQVYFRHYRQRHDHFYHRNSPDCKIPESMEHLLVKMEIYKYLKLAGYEAKLETLFQRNTLSARADVFAKAGKDELVVEIQASSSIQVDTIRRRNTIYAAYGVPTAWIIVLDSFLKKYTGTSKTEVIKHDDGTVSLGTIDLPFDQQEVFQVIGETPKAFDFLLEQYFYVIGVNKDGKFFLIRKELNGTVYNITRIPSHDLVSSLLATPLLDMGYEEQIKILPDSESKAIKFSGNTGFENHELPDIIPQGLHVDFDKGLQDEMKRLKTETPFDTVQLINELNKLREAEKQQIILKAKALEREFVNERRYKPKVEAWNEAIENRKKFVANYLQTIKEDLEKQLKVRLEVIETLQILKEQRLIEQREKELSKKYEPIRSNLLQDLNDKIEALEGRSEVYRKARSGLEQFLNAQFSSIKQKDGYISFLHENEKHKQATLKRREDYGEEQVAPQVKIENSSLREQQVNKEITKARRRKEAEEQTAELIKKQIQKHIEDRWKPIKEMEKEAGSKFTYSIEQVQKLWGKIADQSEADYKRSMATLKQSYESIMRTRKVKPRTVIRRDEIDRLV
jgi:hypothetical protein